MITALRHESVRGFRSETIRLDHKPSGVKLWVSDDAAAVVEGSLPHVSFGTNACLIRDHAHLGEATRKLWDLVAEVAHVKETPRGELTRLDLVLHLPIQPTQLLPVLRHASSPLVRRKTEVYNATSVVFPGSLLRITAYDKAAQMKVGPGTSTRLEISLKKGKSIQTHIGHRELENLNFGQCYHAYRKLVLILDLPPAPAAEYSEPRLVAACEDHEFRPTGISVADWAFQAKNPRVRRQFQKRVAQEMCALRRIDLAALLPEEGPLPACLEPVLPQHPFPL